MTDSKHGFHCKFVKSLSIPSHKVMSHNACLITSPIPSQTFSFLLSLSRSTANKLYALSSKRKPKKLKRSACEVMENGGPTLGVEDGAVEVERLLVEPQEGHVSMDSVLCFNGKIPQIAMGMEEVSPSYGGSNNGIAHEEGDILSGEVLDAMPNELVVGYFQLQNDFCSIGEDYFLGVEFAESVTNLDYGSSEGLQTSVSGNPILTSSADTNMPWKSDVLRIMEVLEDQDDQLFVNSSESSDIPSCHEGESVVEEKPSKSPKSSAIQNIVVIFCSPEQKEGCGLIGYDVENNRVHGQEALALIPAQASCTDSLPLQKRPRKPTRRYIDELASPFLRHPTKKRKVSSFPTKDKPQGVKDHKKCCGGPRALRLPTEESSVIAIQVPFGSLVHKKSEKNHAFDVVPNLDGETLMAKSKDFRVTPDNQKKRRNSFNTVCQKKMDDCLWPVSEKKRDDGVPEAHSKTRRDCVTTLSHKKRDDCILAVNPKKRDDLGTAASLRKRKDCLRATHQKKRGDYFTIESPEEVNGRRKHHRLWTISEVRKLIDGVSQYGVGRWSRIKKLLFSTSAHRTSVDLKDKWRNLLKASGIQEQHKRQGEKKRNMAWCPLPKSILRRVCELAIMYPYPKGWKPKIAHIHHVSPDGCTDITLSDYIRILRSVNGN